MAENYFDPDEKPVAADTQSTDGSKGGVRAAWDAWQSRPENNAALLQFGIAMMQPKAQGQSSLGQFGAAVGEAGEAASRNIATQNLELDREAQRSERTSTAKYRDAQGKAALTNADAYSRIADATAANGPNNGRAALNVKFQLDKLGASGFNKWVHTESFGGDAIVEMLKKEFPDIKNKGDVLSNPRAQAKARAIFRAQAASENPELESTEAPQPTAAPAQAAQPPRPGITTPPSAPQQTPPVPGARFYNGHWYTRGDNGEAVPVPGF